MKFIHISDLHLGKRLNEFSLLEDQQYILTEILNIIDSEKPDGVLIAGDIYDKSVPSEEAIRLWNDFAVRLSKARTQTFVISGNHDSNVRLSGYGELVEAAGIHISPQYDGSMQTFAYSDKVNGHTVKVHMLPFIKPSVVRAIFFNEDIKTYTDAVNVALKHADVNEEDINILVAHQFVTGATTCESEDIVVGGIDNVWAGAFDAFDYVALGHIHGPQSIGRDTLRYSGTPLKYSLSEKNHNKTVTVINIEGKGDISINEVPLIPLRDVKEIKGSYEELASKAFYEEMNRKDYIYAVLTDADDVPNALYKLRAIYPNLCKLRYENDRTRNNQTIKDIEEMEKKSPIDLFEEFFEIQNNIPMSDEQRQVSVDLIKSIWEKN